MPIDPSIIANSMSNIASNMPDVNALMQQRVQGAENIYKIETARQEQAAEAEKEAAEAQEAATLKALLPAYTYGIQTGDMVGAFNLVPPEIRPQLRPYIDALSGKTPQQVQAALIGSLSSSPMGQEALAAIQRAQTAQIQLGQLDVSREDIVLRRQKQALDARGDGEWTLESGEDENGRPIFVWANPRTRQIVKADVTGGVPAVTPEAAPGLTSIPAPLPSTDLVTPRAPAPGAPEVAAPISTAQPPREFRPKVKAGEATGDKQQAREGVDGTLLRIMDQYKILAEEKAIVSAKNTSAENVQARISTKLGPTVGRTVGTKAQTARDTIANLRQALLADIKAATGMSSKAIDSNVELKSFLDSLGDPDQSLETIQNTLAELSIKYGLGTLSASGAGAPAAATGTSGFKIRGVREQ